MWSGNELRLGATTDIFLKNSVRIVEIRNDDIKAIKVVGERFVQFPAPSEKTCQSTGFYGTHAIDIPCEFGQSGDMRIAKDFDVRPRELFAQGGECRKRQDEVTNGATANNEDFALAHAVTARCGSGRATCGLAFFSTDLKTVRPSTITNTPKATRMPLVRRVLDSVATDQFKISRNR